MMAVLLHLIYATCADQFALVMGLRGSMVAHSLLARRRERCAENTRQPSSTQTLRVPQWGCAGLRQSASHLDVPQSFLSGKDLPDFAICEFTIVENRSGLDAGVRSEASAHMESRGFFEGSHSRCFQIQLT